MKSIYFLLISLLIISVSCEDPNDVGAGIFPDQDALEVDSIELTNLVFNNRRDDSILNSSITTHQLGRYRNDVFGVSDATIYTEIFFNGFFNRLDNAVFDSLVLFLNVEGFQGDSLIPQSFNVYEMTDTLMTANNGASPQRFYISEGVSTGQQLGRFDNVLFSSDSTRVDTILTSSHIRTTLDNTFGQSLFQELNDSTITTSNELQEFINGLVITPEENSNGDGWFEIDVDNFFPELTGLIFYYHNDEDEELTVFQITNVLDFQPDVGMYQSGSQNINQIINTYEEAEPQLFTQINNFSSDGNEVGYLQGGNGTYIELDFQNVINNLPPGAEINVAELDLRPTFENLDDTLFIPTSLEIAEGFVRNTSGEQIGPLLGIDGTGFPTTTDFSRFDITSTAFYNSTEEDYSFFLPRTIQSMIDGTIDPKLFILIDERTQSINGIKFEREDLKLKLFYTLTE